MRCIHWRLASTFLLMIAAYTTICKAQTPPPTSSPSQPVLTSELGHPRILDLLHIKTLRREQVENVASTSEYQWITGNFLKYAGSLRPNDLPVDAHELIALFAPPPIVVSSGSQPVEGAWVDAKGMFLGAVGAGPVYQLPGKKDLGSTEFPPIETTLIDGDIAFRQHTGGSTTGPNWPSFLTFASRYLKETLE